MDWGHERLGSADGLAHFERPQRPNRTSERRRRKPNYFPYSRAGDSDPRNRARSSFAKIVSFIVAASVFHLGLVFELFLAAIADSSVATGQFALLLLVWSDSRSYSIYLPVWSRRGRRQVRSTPRLLLMRFDRLRRRSAAVERDARASSGRGERRNIVDAQDSRGGADAGARKELKRHAMILFTQYGQRDNLPNSRLAPGSWFRLAVHDTTDL